MIGYAVVIGLLMLMYGYFTWVVAGDPELSRAQRVMRLALIWLLPIFGIFFVSQLYARADSDSRGSGGDRNP